MTNKINEVSNEVEIQILDKEREMDKIVEFNAEKVLRVFRETDDVIKAAGTFIQGDCVELSADGLIKTPYTEFAQGGLTCSRFKITVSKALERIVWL